MSGAATTADALDDLLAEHASWLAVERGLRPNTLDAYARDLREYAAFLREHGIDDPDTVDVGVVREYMAHRATAPADDGGTLARPPAPSSVARALVAVRSFHRFCVDEGHATNDPTEDVKAPKVPAGIPKALTEAEVGALLGAVVGDEARALRDRAILETLYASGMRITELVALDRADLALEDGLVRVFGKGAKERVVPIGRPACAALDTYLARGRPALSRSGAAARHAGDAVFLNARGE
jgi:integrase/recombinase XerD